MASDTIYRSSSFDNFVSNLPIIALKALEEIQPDMVRTLFKKRDWKPGDGDRVTFDSYALPTYAERADGENSAFPLLGVTEGDTKTVTQVQYVGKMAYTTRMEHFDKEQLATQFTKTVIEAIRKSQDLEMTHKVLTDAEDSTYTPRNKSFTVDWTCADSVALAGTHTLASGDTFSTEYTTAGALSTTTLTAMMQAGADGFKNDAGVPVDFDPDTLIIPNDPFMRKKAFEILGTPKDPATANNTLSIYGPGNPWNMKLVVLNKALVSANGTTRLTTDTARYRYAIADSRYLENWQFQEAAVPQIALKDADIDTVLKVILAYAFSAFATVRAQGYMIHRQNVAKPEVTD